MARKKQKRKNRSLSRLRQAPISPVTPQSEPSIPSQPEENPNQNTDAGKAEEIEKACQEATQLKVATSQTATDEPRPADTDLDKLWQMVCEARETYSSASRKCEELSQQLNTERSKLSECKERLEHETQELQTAVAERVCRTAELTRRESALEEREVDIQTRERNAEQDFAVERRQMRSEFDNERREKEKQLAKRAEELEQFRNELDESSRNLKKEKRQLEYCEQDLEEFASDLEERVERRAAGVREDLEHQIQSLTDQLQQARVDRDKYQKLLLGREELDRKFGQRSPDEVLQELDRQRAEIVRLGNELAESLDPDAAVRLERLVQEQESWRVERTELRREVSRLTHSLKLSHTDSIEREVQRDLIQSLESQRELLHEAHKQIRTEIDELRSRNEAETPFPACLAMDNEPDLHQVPPRTTHINDLADFVEDLQNRIAASKDQLYYREEDLRSFVGGLAMGQLILLQGISGTGKTRLPIQFAQAVGAEATVIEVQAGWRDPRDLVGHYNVFEKKFYEQEFLKALYKAQTPHGEDKLHIVVLDEMNLSHPEQYFSDLLSALELPPEQRRLVLMTHSVEGAPQLLQDGSKLPIPTNVWFIGTANHDETTMDFADKTYDRSHIMEFPHQPQKFPIRNPRTRDPISFGALRDAFKKAQERHSDSADKAIKFLDENLRKPLANNFEVSWGPRLERQMRQYVPVVIAAGGTIGEAVDQILVMRLLRKLKKRYDNRLEYVEELKQVVNERWPEVDQTTKPIRSNQLLDSERQKQGRSREDIELESYE